MLGILSKRQPEYLDLKQRLMACIFKTDLYLLEYSPWALTPASFMNSWKLQK